MSRVTLAESPLVVEAAVLVSLARLGLRFLPVHTLRRILRRSSRPDCHGGSPEAVRRIVRIVTAVTRRLPGRTTCLAHALAADAMLRRRGYASVIRYGVRRSADVSTLDAHAWVEHAGTIVVGEVENQADYAVLSEPN